MHYKNGREAKNGDKVLMYAGFTPGYTGNPVVGVLFDAKAEGGSDCNGNIAPLTSGTVSYADLKNCLHIEDIAAATIPDSSKA